jgi:hypothetical protein
VAIHRAGFAAAWPILDPRRRTGRQAGMAPEAGSNAASGGNHSGSRSANIIGVGTVGFCLKELEAPRGVRARKICGLQIQNRLWF